MLARRGFENIKKPSAMGFACFGWIPHESVLWFFIAKKPV